MNDNWESFAHVLLIKCCERKEDTLSISLPEEHDLSSNFQFSIRASNRDRHIAGIITDIETQTNLSLDTLEELSNNLADYIESYKKHRLKLILEGKLT